MIQTTSAADGIAAYARDRKQTLGTDYSTAHAIPNGFGETRTTPWRTQKSYPKITNIYSCQDSGHQIGHLCRLEDFIDRLCDIYTSGECIPICPDAQRGLEGPL